MKKLLLLLISLFILPIMVSATEYTITDLDMKVDIPDNYLVFTRDNYIDNKDLEELNVSASYMEQSFNLLDIYLDALDRESMEEIFITAQHTSMKNTKEQTYDESKEYMDEVSSSISNGLVVTHEIDLIEIDGIKYYTVGYFDEAYKFYVYNYYIVHNGIAYNIKFQSPNKFEEDDIKNFEKIVKSIEYSDELLKLSDIPTSDEVTTEEDDKEGNNLLVLTIVGVVALILIVVIVLVVRKNKTKKEIETKNNE